MDQLRATPKEKWGHMPNRLASSTSPYLLQHADNPVDWWPWGEEALAEARRREVPILLSVGYAACHWCHVMAHESFEDDQVAAQVNRDFVAIKVDREERPDIDAIYMAATTAMTGHGGWPMTCLLTPSGQPFFAGTYLPKANFQQLLQAATEAWTERREELTGASDRIVAALQQALTQDTSSGRHRCRRTGRGRGCPGRDVRCAQWRVRRRTEVPAVHGVGILAAPLWSNSIGRRVGDGRANQRGDGSRRHL